MTLYPFVYAAASGGRATLR